MENYDIFDEYVMQYDLNEDMIKYKYEHSHRVAFQCEMIARDLKLDNVEMETISLIGLFHDIARFKQWTDYKTFNDRNSFDHGDYAIKILFDEKLIDKLKYNNKYKNIISSSIKNHNKFKIDSNLSKEETLFSKIIRDADKIDILYAFSSHRVLELSEDDSDVDEEIKDAFFRHEQVVYKYVRSKSDKIVELIALVYDLNFKYSIDKILEEKYLDRMYKLINNKKFFKKYFEEAINYLKDRSKIC